MSKVFQSTGSNPFQPIALENKPVACVTDYNKESDKFIIEYSEVDHVKVTGEKDTDFIIDKRVHEVSRTPRQEYIDSFRDDVGILNIIEKVRLSGDATLLDQTHRVGVPGSEKDALGREVEDVADYTAYQVEKIQALEAYKKGVATARQLQAIEGFSGLSFQELARMKDDDIDVVVTSILQKMEQEKAPKEGN